MIRSMLKYKWMCIAVLCCAIFAACEPASDIPTAQTPITFSNGPARAQQVPASAANARIWAYYTTSTTPVTTYDVYGSITGNTTASQTPSTPTGKGENALLTITYKDGNLTGTGALLVNGNTKYWTNGSYDFFSIYSEKFKNTNTNTNPEPTFNFNNGTLSFSYDISDQSELRYACHLNTPGAATRTDKVDFNYQHLLSRVKFQGFSTDQDNPITVTSVSVADVPSKATVSMNIGGVSDPDKKSLTATYSVTSDKFTISNSSATGMTCNNTNGYIVLDKMVFPSDEALKGLTFSVTYNTSSETNKTKTATLPAYNFEAGKSYILKFYIQPSGPIIFGNTVTVEPWDKNDTSNDQNLDFDTTQNNN